MVTRIAAVLGVLVGMGTLTGGCSMTKMAADSTVDIMKAGAPALAEETDLALAEAALVGNLKLMDGLYRTTPENEDLLRMLAEAYSAYAFGFLEPRLWPLDASSPDSAEATALRGRVGECYRRALRYARLRLQLVDEELDQALEGDLATLTARLRSVKDIEDIDALFWVAHTWSLLINTDPDDLEQMANLPTVKAIMSHIAQTAPDHEDGSALVFVGVSAAALGAGLGGDLSKAKEALQRAEAVTKGGFLVPRYMLGRFYCRAINDRACFVEHLETVARADVHAVPHRTLSNVLAQSWAHYWLAHQNELF